MSFGGFADGPKPNERRRDRHIGVIRYHIPTLGAYPETTMPLGLWFGHHGDVVAEGVVAEFAFSRGVHDDDVAPVYPPVNIFSSARQ